MNRAPRPAGPGAADIEALWAVVNRQDVAERYVGADGPGPDVGAA